MRKTLFRLTMLVFLCSNAFAAEVVDTGTLLGEFPVIRWMDNQRVMFLAASGQTCARSDEPDSYKQPLNQIAIFDIQTRQLKWHGEVGVNGLCYADGNITYARRLLSDGFCPKDVWAYFRGRFGEEKAQQPASDVNTYTCLPETQSSPAWLEAAKQSGRFFTPLKPEHGWVEMAYAIRSDGSQIKGVGMAQPVRIFAPDDQGEERPVRGLDVVKLDPRFRHYQFKNAYLLVEHTTLVSMLTGFVRSWWLHPDGRVEPALHYDRALRKGDAHWQENKIIPTLAGYLQIRNRSFSRLPFANAQTGLHLFRPDGSFKKLAGGQIAWNTLAVSPDGCRVAFGADERYAEGRGEYTLKLIDVCKE